MSALVLECISCGSPMLMKHCHVPECKWRDCMQCHATNDCEKSRFIEAPKGRAA